MPIIRDSGDGLGVNWKCTFKYSSPMEMILSLHVMAEPDHHPACGSWARRTYEALEDDLRKEIDFFGLRYAQWIFVADLVNELMDGLPPHECTVDIVTGKIQALDQIEFSYLFLGLSAFNFEKSDMKRWFANPDSVTEADLGVQAQFLELKDVVYFLKNPDEIKARLSGVMKRYWEDVFYLEWEAIRPYEESVVKSEKTILDHSNPIDYIQTLNPKLKVEKGELIYQKDPNFSIPISKIKAVDIIVSVFAEPHFFGNIYGDKAIACMNLNYNSIKMNEPVPKGLLALMNAVSDTTRLKIMRALWNGEITTKELAELLNLSPSTVSLHLKVLKEANLLESRKVKKYVYYKMVKEPFYSIQKDITDYLES